MCCGYWMGPRSRAAGPVGTVKRSDLTGHVGYGYCAWHNEFFWGMRLVLITTPDGMPVIWGLGNPKLGERAITKTLLAGSRYLLHPGEVMPTNKEFSGKDFEAFITDDLQATLLRPDRKAEQPRCGNLGGVRQWIEFVIETLKGQLGLERVTAPALFTAYWPKSVPNCWPWPPASSATGRSMRSANDP